MLLLTHTFSNASEAINALFYVINFSFVAAMHKKTAHKN